MKLELKSKAIGLRETGLSYRQITEQLGVSKSTVSLWVRHVPISREQQDRLKQRKNMGQKRSIDLIVHRALNERKSCQDLGRKEVQKLSQKKRISIWRLLFNGKQYQVGTTHLRFDPRVR
jgi:transposase